MSQSGRTPPVRTMQAYSSAGFRGGDFHELQTLGSRPSVSRTTAMLLTSTLKENTRVAATQPIGFTATSDRKTDGRVERTISQPILLPADAVIR